jgi:glycosyltransferase involved in cell wall biosynthesis
MRIEAFIIAWNEEKLLPYVVHHYKKFCDRIVIYDNHSTDRTVDIALANGCEVIQFGKPGSLDDTNYLEVKNNCWKKSDADFVIVCDCDEVLYHPNLETALAHAVATGKNWFNVIGWNIYTRDGITRETKDITEIRRGVYSEGYSKSIIFDPKALYEINYQPGAHRCSPLWRTQRIESQYDLYLLHYRQVFGFDALMNRHHQYAKRMSNRNRVKGWGIHYLWSDGKKKIEFDERMAAAIDLDDYIEVHNEIQIGRNLKR